MVKIILLDYCLVLVCTLAFVHEMKVLGDTFLNKAEGIESEKMNYVIYSLPLSPLVKKFYFNYFIYGS